MRKILLLIVLFGTTITGLHAQVGIGTQNPNMAAQLDITADPTNPGARGLLIPRVTLTSTTMLLTGISQGEMPNSILVFNKTPFTEGTKQYSVGYYYWATDSKGEKGAGKWVPILAGDKSVIDNFFNTLDTSSSTVVYNSTNNSLEVRTGNGLKNYTDTTGNYVGLGGQLKVDTEIDLNNKQLILKNVKATNASGNFLVLEDGKLKRIEKLDAGVLSGTENISLAGDVTGTLKNTVVKKINGTAVEAVTGSNNDGKVLVYEGSKWVPKKLDATSVVGKTISSTQIDFTNGVGAVLRDVTASIKTGAIGTEQLANNAVTTEKINNNAVTSDKIANNAVGDAQLNKSGITLAGDVTGNLGSTVVGKINGTAVEAVTGSNNDGKVLVYEGNKWVPKKLDASSITGQTITSTQITFTGGAEAVLQKVTATINNGAIGTDLLANNAVTEAKIANDAVTTNKIKNNAVTEAKIANDAVTKAKIANNAVGDAQLDKSNINLAGDVTGNLAATTVEKIQGAEVEKITNLKDTSNNDKVLVFKGAATSTNGKWVPTSLKDAATINYTSTPQETGRKWTLGSSDKVIKEVTLDVDFGKGKTYVDLYNAINKVDTAVSAMNKLSPVSIRLIKKSNGTESISITQSGTYNPTNGNLTVGMNGSMFTVTHTGGYYVVVEYYIK